MSYFLLLLCAILMLSHSQSQSNRMKNDEKSISSYEVEDAGTTPLPEPDAAPPEMETSELDYEIRKLLPDEPNERQKFKEFLDGRVKGYAKALAIAYRKGQLDAMARYFIHHVDCAILLAKSSLENIFNRFKEHFEEKHIRQLLKNQTVSIPDYILQIHLNYDLWILERAEDSSTMRFQLAYLLDENYLNTIPPSTTPAASTVITGETITKWPFGDELIAYFRAWYYIITVPPSEFRDSTVMYLQSLLDKFFDENEHKYTDLHTFYRICAAHLARSHLLTWALHHHWMKKIKKEMSLPENKEVEFESIFLSVIPTWYIEEEQILILNCLRVAVPQKIETVYPIQVLVMQNPRAVSGKDGKTNVIPFLVSSECGVLNWDKAITSNYLPRKRTPVYYERPL